MTLTAIDGAIIDHVFQPIVNRFQLSPKKAALFCLMGSIMTALATLLCEVAYLPEADYCLVAIMIGGALAYLGINEMPDAPFNGRNPRRIEPAQIFFRLLDIPIAVVALLSVDAFVPFMLAAAGNYFSACDQPPPPSRVTERRMAFQAG